MTGSQMAQHFDLPGRDPEVAGGSGRAGRVVVTARGLELDAGPPGQLLDAGPEGRGGEFVAARGRAWERHFGVGPRAPGAEDRLGLAPPAVGGGVRLARGVPASG